MQFLYPGVLWALGLIAVPIIIHLFNFRRVKRVYFSNTTFLRQVRKETNKQSQIKRLLILLARILFIIFLVLAFAQPVTTEKERDPLTLRKIYLDNSLSMSRSGQGSMSLLEEGIQMIDELVNSGKIGLQYSLTTNDYQAGSSRYLTGKEIQERLTEINYSRRFRQMVDVINRMNTQRSISGEEVFIISDFQETSSEDLASIFEDSLSQYHLIKIANEEGGNLYVDSVYLESSIGLSNTNNLHLSLQNSGEQERNNVLVKVFRDSTQFSTFTMDIPANSTATTMINIGGYHQVAGKYWVEIEDNAQVFDNTYYFTIDKPQKVRVVVISEVENKFLKAAFSNPEIFTLDNLSLSSIDYEAVGKADFIVLSGLNRIPDWIEPETVQSASLLVIPGSAIDLESYEELIQLKIVPRKDSLLMTVSKQSLTNPFFEGVFNNINDQISLPWVKNAYQVQGFHQVILNTNLNIPFIIKSGQSNIFFLSVPLMDRYTDFHKHSLFIPVMYKLSQTSGIGGQNLAYSFDDQLVPVKGIQIAESSIPRITNGMQSFVPGVIRSKEEVLLDIPSEIVDPGIYTLTIESDTVTNLAFNYNKKESSVATLSLSSLQQLSSGFENVHIHDVSAIDDFKRSLTEINEGVGLWKYALLLALIFLITEMLLLRFTK